MSVKMPWNILMASRRALARGQRPRAAQNTGKPALIMAIEASATFDISSVLWRTMKDENSANRDVPMGG